MMIVLEMGIDIENAYIDQKQLQINRFSAAEMCMRSIRRLEL